MHHKKHTVLWAQKVASFGMLIALAFVLSYVEALVAVPMVIPGMKLGLANLVVFLALYILDYKGALMISAVRILLVNVTFGTLFTLLYSLAGGLLSFIVMAVSKKYDLFGKTGISVLGGVFHNIGQICVFAFVVNTASVFYYLPFLLIAGTVTGTLIGFLGDYILKRIIRVIDFK